jgi:hypothetical protein
MTAAPNADWRGLVAFLTSNRIGFVKRCLPPLARACLVDSRLSLLVALDGDDKETRAFCAEWNVPLLYSEAREGVGLSKNRVLERFPDYDYYFFVEDDLEIVDGALFARQVELMQAGAIHHLAIFGEGERGKPISEMTLLGERIVQYEYGSAEFNAFTRTGLERVGGWHPLFAQYRRWGHTEHSYRFPRNGLAPMPFNVPVRLAGMCIRHFPPSVTAPAGLAKVDDDGLTDVERELMAQQLVHVPLQTLARYHTENGDPGPVPRLADLVAGRAGSYPLLAGAQRRDAVADFLVWRFRTTRGPILRVAALLSAAAISPRNISLRHAVKVRLLAALASLRLPAHRARVDPTGRERR